MLLHLFLCSCGTHIHTHIELVLLALAFFFRLFSMVSVLVIFHLFLSSHAFLFQRHLSCTWCRFFIFLLHGKEFITLYC